MKFDDDLDMRAIARALGDRLRAFREKHGLSQQDVADRTGIAREHYGRFERGALPSVKNIIVLSRFMDVMEHELLHGSENEQVVITNRLIRDRVVRIERISYEAQRWVLELMDAFILKAAGEEEDDHETRRRVK